MAKHKQNAGDSNAPDDDSLQSSAYAADVERLLAACGPECDAIVHEHETQPGVVGGPLDTGRAILSAARRLLNKLFELGLIEAKKG